MLRNCFVKCVGFKRNERGFTLGKVYQVINGELTRDDGHTYTDDFLGHPAVKWLSKWYVFDIVDEHDESLNTHVCNHCGSVVMENEYHELNDIFVCDDCFNEYYVECEMCGEFVHRFDSFSTIDGIVCETCLYDNYSACDVCGEYVLREDLVWNEERDEYVCVPCDEELRSRCIHDYGYKPLPLFYGADGNSNALFMGVELEIDGAGESHCNAQRISDIANAENEHIYMKHDGSISSGFEIVSHPATLEYHKNAIAWRDIMQEAVEMGYRSHNTETCGLHIHISRKALGDCLTEEEATISKIVYFVENNWREILKFTRRSRDRMRRWAARYGIDEDIPKTYEAAKCDRNRYKCINLQNDDTVEFRMFRGTLKHETFIATLQLVSNICNICKTATLEAMEWFTWKDFIRSIDEKNNVELVEYLKTRGLYV